MRIIPKKLWTPQQLGMIRYYPLKKKSHVTSTVYVAFSGEKGTNQISKNQLYKGLGKVQKTVDTFNILKKTKH